MTDDRTLEPLDVETISQQTHDRLSHAIITGTLGPGAQLSDRRLADQLGVSRTPVREALHLLESSGLVARRGRIGWVVTNFGADEAHELYQLRRIFESAGFEDLEEWTDDLIEEIGALISKTEPTSPGQVEAVVNADREFHRKLVQASGNARLVDFYDVVSAQIDRIRYYVPIHDRDRLSKSYKEHVRIYEALTKRDPAKARESLYQHLIAAEEAMLSLL